MKKKYLIFLMLILVLPFNSKAKEVNVDLFYGKECMYCHRELNYLDKLEKQFGKNLKLNKYEVWHNKKNANSMEEVKKNLGEDSKGVPLTIINDKHYIGFSDSIGKQIKKDILNNIDSEMYLPILGRVDILKINSFLICFTAGLSDAVNFGSLFVLFVLFGILLGIYDNKKRIKLGSIYVITYSLFYFILGLLKLNLSDNMLMIIKMVVSILPIVIGAILIDAYLKIHDVKISTLEWIQEKTRDKQNIFYFILMVICALIVTLVCVNFAGGVPLLLNRALEIKGISEAFYGLNLFVYFISFFSLSYIIFIIMNIIVKEIFMENSISVYNRLIGGIVLLILSAIIIFMPNLFLF